MSHLLGFDEPFAFLACLVLQLRDCRDIPCGGRAADQYSVGVEQG
jgi:hypothetical protein